MHIPFKFSLFLAFLLYYTFMLILLNRSCYSVNQDTEFTAKGLQESKEYEFRVAACNSAGTGEFSGCSKPFKVQSLPGMIIAFIIF
jgi:hypothetical protein